MDTCVSPRRRSAMPSARTCRSPPPDSRIAAAMRTSRPRVRRVEVHIETHERLSHPDGDGAQRRVRRRRAEVRSPFGVRQLPGQTLELSGPDAGKGSPRGGRRGPFVEEDGDAPPAPPTRRRIGTPGAQRPRDSRGHARRERRPARRCGGVGPGAAGGPPPRTRPPRVRSSRERPLPELPGRRAPSGGGPDRPTCGGASTPRIPSTAAAKRAILRGLRPSLTLGSQRSQAGLRAPWGASDRPGRRRPPSPTSHRRWPPPGA